LNGLIHIPYLAVGAVLKGENYWETLPELAERSRVVEKEEEGGKIYFFYILPFRFTIKPHFFTCH
jgi:hypothetical protein